MATNKNACNLHSGERATISIDELVSAEIPLYSKPQVKSLEKGQSASKDAARFSKRDVVAVLCTDCSASGIRNVQSALMSDVLEGYVLRVEDKFVILQSDGSNHDKPYRTVGLRKSSGSIYMPTKFILFASNSDFYKFKISTDRKSEYAALIAPEAWRPVGPTVHEGVKTERLTTRKPDGLQIYDMDGARNFASLSQQKRMSVSYLIDESDGRDTPRRDIHVSNRNDGSSHRSVPQRSRINMNGSSALGGIEAQKTPISNQQGINRPAHRLREAENELHVPSGQRTIQRAQSTPLTDLATHGITPLTAGTTPSQIAAGGASVQQAVAKPTSDSQHLDNVFEQEFKKLQTEVQARTKRVQELEEKGRVKRQKLEESQESILRKLKGACSELEARELSAAENVKATEAGIAELERLDNEPFMG